MATRIRFGVQASPLGQREWTETAKRSEGLGFDFLCCADHPGSRPSPIVSLAAAAAVTDRIKLGTYVSNAGIRDPLDLAIDIATLDVVSNGRAVLGLGAGHTPGEWEARGAQRPSAQQRIARLIDVVTATRQLLEGEAVSLDRSGIRLVEAQLEEELQRKVPLLIGGTNAKILRFAAEHADVIGLTGLGRTLDGGHRHALRWSRSQLAKSFSIARSGTGRAQPPEIQALVQVVNTTEDPNGVAEEVAARSGAPVIDILNSPFVLLGTIGQIVERIQENAETWGIDSYVVRSDVVDEIGKVIAKLG